MNFAAAFGRRIIKNNKKKKRRQIMAKVLGVGGIFFKSPDPQKLMEWYTRWLNFPAGDGGSVSFMPASMPDNGMTVWSPFKADTTYFAPSVQAYMFNLVVDNLDEALQQVQEGGANLVGQPEDYSYGRFGWFIDPDGNKVELWQPL
jgi:predicted enzyme related to lactoylglutathione lyase